jgi:hypothetical protein
MYDEARALAPDTARLCQDLLSVYIERADMALVIDLGCGTGRFSELMAAHRMSKLVTLQMSSFASRAFEMAMPPRRSSLPSPPSISFSDEWMSLRQRARSCETPLGNRPRVGPPRSPASSSGAPRSRTVGDVRCSKTSEPTHLSYAA